MKKFILITIITLAFGATNLYSQKIKKETIYNRGLGVNHRIMWAEISLDDNNNVLSRNVVLAGQDYRFSKISSIIIAYIGSAKELNNFMRKLDEFYEKNEKETYDTIEGKRVRRAKFGIGIYDKDEIGQIGFHIKDFRKMKKALEEWAKKNNELLE
ncbi:hypothetical protein HZY62_21840 [Maribacter polysiphoniae]|uniref:Uncharacterized protein n=1 Tax=Maribacter polysiphoniae TaxID=429344 RepID=A0A316DHQ9_9FLAO|nr:hypothetical protein [Maribacter polysiphoniae]MBD1263243.1 hypothetical protein [Maribacter polysiphoniae]PWK17226.1 hypothetical protein LX92_04458 [Maribacter polysiphoniae]